MVEKIITRCGRSAALKGDRCSPHTLRHTKAVKFLRNSGDIFSLQHIIGRSQLEVLRGCVNLAQPGMSGVHQGTLRPTTWILDSLSGAGEPDKARNEMTCATEENEGLSRDRRNRAT